MDRWHEYSLKAIEQLSVDELLALHERVMNDADNINTDYHELWANTDQWEYEGDLHEILRDIDDELESRNN